MDLAPVAAAKPKLHLIFRKKNPLFFSIEKVFALLKPILEAECSLQEQVLPHYSSSVGRILRNILSLKSAPGIIYHVTGDVHYAVLGLPRRQTILTVHDSVFLETSHGLKRLFFQWLFLRLPVSRCQVVTTISAKSKQEIIRYTGCRPDKILVIPDPVESCIYPQARTFNQQNPVLLFIGSTPNKNLDRIIEAITPITCTLHIVGKISDAQREALDQAHIRYRVQQDLSDQEMADAYAACDIVLFPSLYEGFGLPIIEGQKAGRVVLTSNISPMREVAGLGACLVDPYDAVAIRTGIQKLIDDQVYREKLIQAGFSNVAQYSPARIAGLYLNLYRKMMEQMGQNDNKAG